MANKIETSNSAQEALDYSNGLAETVIKRNVVKESKGEGKILVVLLSFILQVSLILAFDHNTKYMIQGFDPKGLNGSVPLILFVEISFLLLILLFSLSVKLANLLIINKNINYFLIYKNVSLAIFSTLLACILYAVVCEIYAGLVSYNLYKIIISLIPIIIIPFFCRRSYGGNKAAIITLILVTFFIFLPVIFLKIT